MTEMFHEYAAGSAAGLVAGVLIGGIGGRVIMRVAALIAGADADGTLTANGNVVGDFTVEGTVGLIIFAGALPGVFGGLLYAALRPWLAPVGRWEGFAFGLLLLVALGSSVIDPTNFDFGRFVPPALAVSLFAVLFIAFGAFNTWLYLRMGPVARGERGWPQVLLGLGALSALYVLSLLATTLVGALVGRGEGAEAAATFFVVAVPLLLIAAVTRAYAGGPTLMSYALLALPFLVGAQRTASGILTLVAR